MKIKCPGDVVPKDRHGLKQVPGIAGAMNFCPRSAVYAVWPWASCIPSLENFRMTQM